MERLVEIRELKGKVADLETEIHELLEENERLRKAGDELARVNDCRTGSAAFDIYIDEGKVEAIKAWLAAKGVQS
jgi:regulator of replication initiation timing